MSKRILRKKLRRQKRRTQAILGELFSLQKFCTEQTARLDAGTANGAQGDEKGPLPDWSTAGGTTIIVPVEVPPAAYALLKACTGFLGCGSVAEYMLICVKGDVRDMCRAFGNDETNGTLEQLFAAKGKEAR